MGTISNSLTSAASTPSSVTANTGSTSSSSASSSSSGTTTGFTGTSQYSQDLQNYINRAVQIADLPVQLLQNQQNALNSQSGELTTVDGLVVSLQTAVQGIQSAMNGSSFTATVSDPTVVTATMADGAQEGVYPIQVQSIGSYASGTTTSDWGTPAKGATFNLVVGGKSYGIATTDTSASGIATAINQQYGNLVQAAVLQAGSASAPSTRISLQAASLGAQTLDLQTSNGTSLFNQAVGGSQAEYSVPGTGAPPVFTNSRSVEISPGVNLTMLTTSASTVNVTVSRSTSALSNALSIFATAYNNVVDEIAKQHGQNAGPLQGSAILQTITQSLTQIGTYGQSSGEVNSLSSLGLDLNKNGDGHFTFNSFSLAGTDIANSSQVDAFLGDGATSGFLKTALGVLTNLEDPLSGLVKNAETDLQTQITNIGANISTKQTQVTQLQTTLQKQMAQADALLSTMQQQYNVINQLFLAQQTANQQMSAGL